MTKISETKALSLNERVKQLSILTINGVSYLGKAEKVSGKILEVSEAVEIAQNSALESTIKTWIRQDNLDSLDVFTLEGDFSLAKKGFNNDQIYLIDKVTSEAAYNMSRVLKNLENSSF